MANSKFLVVNPDTMPGDGDLCPVIRASSTHGGLTVIAAYLNTGAVGTLNIQLINYGSTGTVAGGTIAEMADGTATVWAADTPQALTITSGSEYVDAGEWVYAKKVESAAGNDLSADASIIVEYVDGVVTQG